jgi:hypothetical protein
MRTEYSVGSKNKYQKIRRSAMRKRHFSRRNVNEYFHKKNNFNTWQNKVVFFFFLFIFIYIIYFFFFSNYFKINQIIIEGNEEILTLELKEKCYDLLGQRKFLIAKKDNYFLFNVEELKEKLSKDYLFEELKIEKKYFSTIFINLKEKPHKLFYIIDGNSFLIDENGIVISHLNYEEIISDDSEKRRDKGKIILEEVPKQLIVNQEEIDKQKEKIVKNHELYENTNSTSTVFVWENSSEGMIVKEVDLIDPQIKDVYPDFPKIGSNIFSSDIIQKILYLDANYNHKFGENRDYYEFEYEKNDFLIMLTKENFKIFFKLNEAIDSQLSNLYRYLIEEGNSTENIEYIDLRQKDQIIIK